MDFLPINILGNIFSQWSITATAMDVLNEKILENTLLQWSIAGTALITTLLVLRIIQRVTRRRCKALASQTETNWDDIATGVVAKTKFLFLLIISLYVGSLFLDLPARVHTSLSNLLSIALFIQMGIWAISLLTAVLDSHRQRAREKNPAAVTMINMVGLISKVFLWSTVVLLVLSNLGVNITSLIAGLGIGGVAVALAIQNILGDLFASLSIVIDKPFVNGDFIIINEFLGTIERIGLKSTRIRSLSGEQLVFSNSDLLKSRIRNYGRMYERRVVFSIGVVYQTAREKLKEIPEIIHEVIKAQDKTRFDRSHFMKYGDYSLQFETVYYIQSPDYNLYMDIQQAIYFTIHERFEQEKIEFAYPTQTVFVSKPVESISL